MSIAFRNALHRKEHPLVRGDETRRYAAHDERDDG